MTVWNSLRSRLSCLGLQDFLPTCLGCVCVGEGRSHDLKGTDTGVHKAPHDRGGADQNVT